MRALRSLKLANGVSPFKDWMSSLNPETKIRILAYLRRLEKGGSKKNIKPLGDKVFELKIRYSSGYRIYFAELDSTVILILCGGSKSTQKKDINRAKLYWRSYALQNRIIR